MKHTPGPWIQRTAGDPTPGKGTQIYAKGENIATIHYGVVDIDTALNNARLIAAAPRLLAFAELVRDFFENDSSGHARYLYEQAQNALASIEDS